MHYKHLSQQEITYPHIYDEPLNQAKKVLETTETIEILLAYLVEYSQMWHKTKCTAKNYGTKQFADVANGYAEGVNMIKQRIIELFERTKTTNDIHDNPELLEEEK